MKKTLSFVLALMMVLAVAVPAFASTTDTTYNKTAEYTGTTQVPTITVTIPTTGTVTVNPYKMEVTVGSDKKTDQVISATQYVKNESNVAIALDVTVTGKTEGEAVFATAPITDKIVTKSVFMYFEIKAATDASTEPTWAAAYDAKARDQILLAAKATTKKDVITLAAGDTTETYAGFRLTGNAADKSTKPWAATDKVGATIAFTIKPVVTAPATGG